MLRSDYNKVKVLYLNAKTLTNEIQQDKNIIGHDNYLYWFKVGLIFKGIIGFTALTKWEKNFLNIPVEASRAPGHNLNMYQQ